MAGLLRPFYNLKQISSEGTPCLCFLTPGYYFSSLWFFRCWSSVGKLYKRPGAQEISLANGCLMHSTIMHEVLHSLGFWHEQSRPDRDQFIEIFWENIQDGK